MSLFSEQTAMEDWHRSLDQQREADDADDAARVQRWNDFIEAIRRASQRMTWWDIVGIASDATDPNEPFRGRVEVVCRDYAASDGAPMMLRAIARAIEVEQIDRDEKERRR